MKIIKDFKKITVVGGGSAGWMTAAMMIRFFPDKCVSVIESPDHPTVGVGESTLLGIKDYCHFIQLDELDFMQHTDASYKMSIKFTDFYEKNSGGFHYPFGEPYFDDCKQGLDDWFFKKANFPETENSDFARSYYPNAALYEQGKFSDNRIKKYGAFDPKKHVAYHFDATKFGLWLKDRYCLPRGVNLISANVIDAEVSEDGIENLLLDNGDRHASDLYIDCTGFKSLLLGQYLQQEFIPYNDMLPNNRAWATRIPYKDKERELEPYTNCTALGHGWVWNIPVWSRLGTGYVYSDKFIDPEAAKEEFKQHLMSNKMICPRTREEVDALEFKDIQMRVGIHKRTFVKNVVAIGLSAGFIEPLESNGLFSVHVFLEKLVKIMLSGSISQFDIDTYNKATRHVFQNFAEFVALHYAFSKRNDTDYWKANNARVYDKEMMDLIPSLSVGFADYAERKMFSAETDPSKGLVWVATGMNHPIIDRINSEKVDFFYGDTKKTFAESWTKMELNKKKWWESAAKELSLNQWLAKHIHKDQT